jgi:flagellar biosynthesis protein FlhF
MRLKSYFAGSLQEAMNRARAELGPEAMLISSRQTGSDLKDLGAFEVVFGLAPAPPSAHSHSSDQRRPENTSSTEVLLRELAELRKQFESFTQSVAHSNLLRTTEQLPPELGSLAGRLQHAGFSNLLAQELVAAVAARLGLPLEGAHRIPHEQRDVFTRDLMRAVLEQELSHRFRVDPALAGESTVAVMLVGPPGAGKTSSLVKLGLQYGLKERRPLELISLDTLRIGGYDQLSKYARIVGARFRALTDFPALAGVLPETSTKALTLIDTPGFGEAEQEEIANLANAARTLPIEVHLVLPACTNLAAAARICQRFAELRPSKLLLTHLDSVQGPAIPVELAIQTGLPLSFFGTGQQIPEDMRPAAQTALLSEILPHERAASMPA